MLEKKKSSTFKLILKVIKKKISPVHIILLIVLLASNTFAWFIYAQEVSNTVDVHVRAWKVVFEASDSPIVDYLNIDVSDVYPGMTDFEQSLTAYNKSEVSAKLSYQILSARILNNTYITIEGRAEKKEEVQTGDMTSETLVNKLGNDYPFKITFDVTSTSLDAIYGESVYTVKVKWDYESGDDDQDTYWGSQAYEFSKNHPDTSPIELKLKLLITQDS